MAHERFTVHVGDRGRFVLPADVRRRLELNTGDRLVIDVDDDEDTFVVRKATDVAHGFRGYLGASAPDRDLAAELIAERREEAEREEHDAAGQAVTAIQ
jgi:AbrB family looped-hinge helix DNA binding protein